MGFAIGYFLKRFEIELNQIAPLEKFFSKVLWCIKSTFFDLFLLLAFIL